MAALRTAFLSAATEERLKELGEKLYAAAAGGDWQAAKLFLLFVVGKPAEAVNADTLDLEEFKLLEQSPSFARVMRLVIDTAPAGLAAELAKGFLPADLARVREMFFRKHDDDDEDEDGGDYAYAERAVELMKRMDQMGK